MLALLYYALLLLALVAGWLLNILGLPGLWVMVLAHVLYAYATGWDHYTGWTAVIVLFILALSAEIIEFVAGAAGSRKAGGTKRGMLGAVGGGLIGGIVGSVFIPIPILGTIVGAVGGSFAGASAIEKMIHPDSRRALKIGYGAAKGRLLGIVIKSSIGLVMALISFVAAAPLGPPRHTCRRPRRPRCPRPCRDAAATECDNPPAVSPTFRPVFTRPAHYDERHPPRWNCHESGTDARRS